MVRLILPVPFFPLFPFPLKGGREISGMGNTGKSRNGKFREKTGKQERPNKDREQTESRPRDRKTFSLWSIKHADRIR